LHSGTVVGPPGVGRVGLAPGLRSGEGLRGEGVSAAGGEGVEVEVQGRECCHPGLGAKVDLDDGGSGALRRRPLDQDVGVAGRRTRERVRHRAVREARVIDAVWEGPLGEGGDGSGGG